MVLQGEGHRAVAGAGSNDSRGDSYFPLRSISSIAFAELSFWRWRTRPNQRLAGDDAEADPSLVDEPLIERAEVVALLFNVSDIAASLATIERLLEEDDGEEEDD
jgi:hypothetical protein